MEIKINGFKSVKNAHLSLGKVTVLLGPPASGKSNLMEAMAFATYFDRYAFYEDVEPLSKLVRTADIRHLFSYGTKNLEIDLGADWRRTLNITLWDDAPDVKLDDVKIYLRECGGGHLFTYNGRRYCVEDLPKSHEKVLVRLYGFNRFREDIINSMSKGIEAEAPQGLLREDGKNFGVVAAKHPEVIQDLNAELKELSRAEVRVLEDGRVVMFGDGVVAARPTESILSALYVMLGLASSTEYARLNGLEGRSTVLLEEPEERVYPRLLHLLVKYIEKFSEVGYVVITTHNPILVSLLRDKFDVALYYVYRGDGGFTEVAELDKDKMAKGFVTSADIVFMLPYEVFPYLKQ
jgi:predicted ATPase